MAKKKKKTFGEKLKLLRKKEGLSIEELSAQVNMKPSYLRALENDETLPPVAEILTLARTLSVEPSSFMDQDQPKASMGRRRKTHEVRIKDYAYENLAPYEHGSHLMAFRIIIDPESTHRKVGYQHDGEEFIYVLSGKLRLKVGRKSMTLGTGESIRFDSSQRHILKNPGKDPATLLVVLYTP